MKSYNHLWERLVSDDNYYLAVENATKGKTRKNKKHRRARYYREHAAELKDSFLEYVMTYKHQDHKPIEVYDGIRRKKRQIYVPNIEEQILHHMIVNIFKPIFMKSMYEHSYGSIPGRGAHKAKKVIERWIHKNDRHFKYILKMDIKKYFDSVPHDILKRKLAGLIHDDRFLNLLFEIIDTTDVGIPIGFFTSQWIANWYLTELDHYIKEVLGVKYYVRYMDDMVVAGSNKRKLHRIRCLISEYLERELGLQMKKNWQVYLFDYKGKGRDLDFMGFRFFRDRTVLRRTIFLKAMRKARRIKARGLNIYTARQMLSYLGWFKYTNTYGAYLKYIKPFLSFRTLRRYVSRWDKKHNQEVNYGLV